MIETAYRWQQCRDGYDISSDPYAGEDATSVRAWAGAHGDTLLLAAERTPRGRWRIDSSDTYDVPLSAYDKRFGSPLEALTYLAQRAGQTPREAVCRCGTGPDADDCD